MQNFVDEYNLGTDDMNDVSRWFQTRKAAGIVPQPWELDKLLQNKYKALYNERANMRNLGVQEKMLGVREKTLAEQARMNDIRVQQNEKDRQAAREAGIWNLAGSVGTTALMYPYLKKY